MIFPFLSDFLLICVYAIIAFRGQPWLRYKGEKHSAACRTCACFPLRSVMVLIGMGIKPKVAPCFEIRTFERVSA